MPDRRRLCVRMDDACSTPGHAEAQARLLRGNVALSAGVMVPPDDFAATIGLVRDVQKQRGDAVALGLHLTLNCEFAGGRWRPVAGADRVPDLVDDDGFFLPMPADNDAQGKFDVGQMMIEAKAQLAALRSAGMEPTYLDEHMNCSWPGGEPAAAALREWADAEGLANAAIPPKSATFAPPRDADGRYDPPAVLRAILDRPNDGRPVCMVLHPALAGDTERNLVVTGKHIAHDDADRGKIALQRQADYDLLASPALADAAARGDVEFVTMPEFVRAYASE